MAFLVELRSELATRGVEARITGTSEGVRHLLELYGGHEAPALPEPREPHGVLDRIGRGALGLVSDVKEVLAFVGESVPTAARFFRRPRSAHLGEVPILVQRAGPEAIVIVAVINFLVGFVMAYQSAKQLQKYGANLYVADVVGIAQTRELGPLMTAVIVCGRSGASFTAEIGTMKVEEEIDALRTMGLAPFGWLVVPRVLALVIVTPILTLLADLAGVAGGAFVAVNSLDLTFRGYLDELRDSVDIWDVGTGVIKSVVFAVGIALIACQQGFATSGGAEGVGRRTTNTVVTSLFMLAILDSTMTAIFRGLGV